MPAKGDAEGGSRSYRGNRRVPRSAKQDQRPSGAAPEGLAELRSKTKAKAKRSLPACGARGRQTQRRRPGVQAPRAAERDRQGSRSRRGDKPRTGGVGYWKAQAPRPSAGRPQGCRSAGGRRGADLASAAWKPKAPGGRCKTRAAGPAPEARGRRRKKQREFFCYGI